MREKERGKGRLGREQVSKDDQERNELRMNRHRKRRKHTKLHSNQRNQKEKPMKINGQRVAKMFALPVLFIPLNYKPKYC